MRHPSGALISRKSYGAAVCLSAVFGVLGIHHFYLGRHLHGLFDLGLTASFIYFFAIDRAIIGLIFLVVDVLHTLIVTIQLLVGAYRDGEGGIVAYPGQFKNQPHERT